MSASLSVIPSPSEGDTIEYVVEPIAALDGYYFGTQCRRGHRRYWETVQEITGLDDAGLAKLKG